MRICSFFVIKDLRTVDAETFNERVAAFEASGQYDEYLASYKAQKTASAEKTTTADTVLSTITDTAQGKVQNTAKSLDNESGLRYAKTKAKYIPYSAIGMPIN